MLSFLYTISPALNQRNFDTCSGADDGSYDESDGDGSGSDGGSYDGTDGDGGGSDDGGSRHLKFVGCER